MDRTCICHCKSVEFICSVGKVILTDQNIKGLIGSFVLS